MSRKNWWILNLFLMIIAGVSANVIFIVLLSIIQLWAMSNRMLDIGMTRWWLLGTLVPVVNIYPGFMCAFAPSGYKKEGHENFKNVDGGYQIGLVFVFAICGILVYTLLQY